jgi:O-antigen ligase
VTSLINHPVGLGLGANTGTGTRFNTSNQITSENSYLETGNELGIAAMLLFICMLLTLLWQLRRRAARGDPAGRFAGGLWLGGWGLAIGGLFLQVWYELAVALVFWTLAGAALAEQDDRSSDERAEDLDVLSDRALPGERGGVSEALGAQVRA